MRCSLPKLLLIFCLAHTANSYIWLPFANFDSMLSTLKHVAFKEDKEEIPSSMFDLGFLKHASRDMLNNLGTILTNTLNGEQSRYIANGIRELFNVTTPATTISNNFTPRMPLPRPEMPSSFTYPPYYSTRRPPYFPVYTTTPSTTTTTTKEPTTTTVTTTTTPTTTSTTSSTTTTTPRPTTSTTTMTTPQYRTFAPPTTTTSVYPIWPTTPRRPKLTWKPIIATTDSTTTSTTTEATSEEEYGTFPYGQTTPPSLPEIIKRKLRPYIETSNPDNQLSETCQVGKRCNLALRSFETSNPLFRYAYDHSSPIDDTLQSVLKDTKTIPYSAALMWQATVAPEVIQLIQTLVTIQQPIKCLVIGVFTGLGVVGIAESIDHRGIVIGLEHPELSSFWSRVGLKHAQRMAHSQISRIEVRSTEEIEKSLARLSISEYNSFDFIFLDDFKRSNYLEDYENSVRLLRSGGVLVINQALNGGGVLSGPDFMSNDDRSVRDMNIRIKQDSRVRSTLLPYSGGVWMIYKK